MSVGFLEDYKKAYSFENLIQAILDNKIGDLDLLLTYGLVFIKIDPKALDDVKEKASDEIVKKLNNYIPIVKP